MPAVGRLWTAGVMSSVRQDWATPRQLFAMLDREFHFGLDACASKATACCRVFLDCETTDALLVSWSGFGAVWCNPPYGRKVGRWIANALEESRRGATVVMLLPARTDTSWFHDYCLKGEIRFLRGRLKFDDKPSTIARAPFPSMLVIFRPAHGARPEARKQ